MNTISRRSLGKGAAWSVPAIIAAGAVPAMAASQQEPQPEVDVNGRVTWNYDWNSSQSDGLQDFKVYSIIPNSVYPGRGFRVLNSKSSTVIGPMTVTFYLPTTFSNTTFQARYDNNYGWSPLTRDYSKATEYANGETYYAFTTQYNSNLQATDGTTNWPPFSFESNTYKDRTPRYYYVTTHTTVDGQDVNYTFGPLTLVTAS